MARRVKHPKQADLRKFFGGRSNQHDAGLVEAETAATPCDTDTCTSSPPAKSAKLRTFNGSWLDRFKWLRYSEERNVMECDVCLKANVTCPFTEGCSNFQHSTLSRHQDSKSHLTSVKILSFRSQFTTACKSAEDRQLQGKSNELEAYAAQLRTVYLIAKRDLPCDVFTDIMHLQNLNGLDIEYYKRPQIVMEFEECIQRVIEKSLIDSIHASDFIGIMLDETCDITVHKKLAIYVRYIQNGEANVSFLGNQQITDATAAGVETALIEFLISKEICDAAVDKIYGLGTDGAAVMTGRLNGLGAKLKARNPNLVQVHCVAHRLNLAASQAGRDIEYCKEYHNIIHSLYKYFNDSSVRYDKLREIQTLLNGKAKQITEPTSVRWLSVESAVKMIFISFEPIALALASDKKGGKADGLLKFVSNSLFLLFTALLIDVLTVIGILSLTFQKDSVNLSHIKKSVQSTRDTLNTMTNDSHTVREVFNALGDVPGNGQKNTYKNIQITYNQPLRQSFCSVRENYINKLLQNLDCRFPDDEMNILECFDVILNPHRYPENLANLPDYGVNQLDQLLNHHNNTPGIDADRARAHFLVYKHFTRSHTDALNFDMYIKLLLTDFTEEYPDLAILAKIALVIPVSSAPCERGFSVQNAIKQRARNRLNPQRLNRLMFIKLVVPIIDDFDFMNTATVGYLLKELLAECELKPTGLARCMPFQSMKLLTFLSI